MYMDKREVSDKREKYNPEEIGNGHSTLIAYR